VELRVLGPVEVWARGERVPLGGPRATKLLAALALEAGRAVPLARLVDVLWDEDPPATASRQARNTAGALRRVLGDVLVTDGPGYRLAAGGLRIDAEVFADRLVLARDAVAVGETAKAASELRDALGLWRGPALAGLDSRVLGSAALELDEHRLATLEECLGLELDLGLHRELVAELSAAVAEHPLRERFSSLLMLALHRGGRSGEALVVYQRFRARLAEELGLDPSPELRRLESAILRADPSLQPAGSLVAVVPRQLPADTPVFAGRASVLESLPRTGVITIDGPPGVGKTTLAVRFAHRVAGQFPDGQLYADLRGFDPAAAPLPPAAVLARFLRALGADPVPADLDEQAALYRTLLADKRVLIVLDNAAGADQVRPLLPASGLVVVTSRNRLSGLVAGHGAHRITLDLLTSAESVELLRQILGPQRIDREPDAVAVLIERAARLPLALRILGERAHRLVSAPLAELVAELGAERARLDALDTGDGSATNVRAVFSHSYRALDAPVARMFRLLALAPGRDIAVSAAAALTGQSTSDTRAQLDTLTAASLLSEPSPGRFTMHDLLRDYARELVADAEALARVLDFYLHTAYNANLRLARLRWPLQLTPTAVTPLTFDDHQRALAWCDAERENLLAATESAAAAGFDRHAWQLPCLLWEYYYLRKHWADWVGTHEIGLAAARHLGDRSAEARVLNGLGAALGDQGLVPAARSHYEDSLRAARAAGDDYTEAVALHNLGIVHRTLGEHRDALRYFGEALDIDQRVGEPNGEAIVLSAMAGCYLALGQHTEALDHYRRALRLHPSARAEAQARHGIGECHHDLGRHAEALESYRDALALREAADDLWGTATTLTSLGRLYRDTGDVSLARDCWRQAHSLFTRLHDPRAAEIARLLAR
jgi:DNA-binding SARP family transcriptional activator